MRARVVSGVVGAGLVLASCGTTARAEPRSLAVNDATVRETATGALVAEVQAYQHGQVLEASGGRLELRTPEGVSTRAGVNIGLTGTGTVWAAANAEIELYVTPIFVGPVGSFHPAELQVAVAPFPGALDPLSQTSALALVGTKAYGARNQSLVVVSSAGQVVRTVASRSGLEALAGRAGCSQATFRAVIGAASSPTLLASCADSRLLALVRPSSGSARLVRAPGTILGVSALSLVDGHPEVAAIVERAGAEDVVIFGQSRAVVPLTHRATASPSLAASGTFVLVPETSGRSQLVGLDPSGRVVLDREGPRDGQGVGTTRGGRALVVAANPNGDVVTLWLGTASGYHMAGELAIPEGVDG